MTDDLVPSTHVERATWYTAGLSGPFGSVGSVIPTGFDSYARLLHPARAVDGTPRTWAQVAAETCAVMHPLAQFGSLAGRRFPDVQHAVGWSGENPEEGSLPRPELTTLCRILAGFTTTPDRCWLTVWEGWGTLPEPWRYSLPRIHQPHRAYYLFELPLTEVVGFGERLTSWAQSPNQWWPDDRAWCVATEIDFDSTFVAGSRELVDALLAEPTLEVVRVRPEDDLTWAGDVVNPAP